MAGRKPLIVSATVLALLVSLGSFPADKSLHRALAGPGTPDLTGSWSVDAPVTSGGGADSYCQVFGTQSGSTVTGTIQCTTVFGVGTLSGTVTPPDVVNISTEWTGVGYESDWSGTINSPTNVTGTWSDNQGNSGTFTADKQPTQFTDATDDTPGDGYCDVDASPPFECSLRALIQETNALAGSQTIGPPAGTYTLSIAGGSEDAAATGDLDITDGLTITGDAASTTIVDAGGLDRVFHVHSSSTATLEAMTITDGAPPSGQGGGGIFVDFGILTLDEMLVDSNTVTSANSGGVNNVGGTLIIINSTISNNHADNAGGVGTGGSLASTSISHSTVNDNTVDVSAGGVGNAGGALTTLENSTISGNEADVDAGGIGQADTGSSLDLSNTTVVLNVADADSTSGGIAGGIGHDGMGSVTMQNSIVAKNTAATDPDCAGTISSDGYNLLGEDSTSCSFTSTTGDQVGPSGSPIDPLIGRLRDNGGPTQTHAISVVSPAIDAGDPAVPDDEVHCQFTDQRGEARPLDGDSDEVERCDIGAYERQGATEEPCTPPEGGFCDTYDFHAEFDTEIQFDTGTAVVPCEADGHLRSEREPTTGPVTDVEITYLDGYVDCPGDFFLGSSIPNEGTLTEQTNNDPNTLEFPLDGEFTICVTVASLQEFGGSSTDLHTCPDGFAPENKAPLEFSCKILSLSSFDCDIDTATLYDDDDTVRATVQPDGTVDLSLISSVGGVAEAAPDSAEPLRADDAAGPDLRFVVVGGVVAAVAVVMALGGLAWRRMRRVR